MWSLGRDGDPASGKLELWASPTDSGLLQKNMNLLKYLLVLINKNK